MTLETLIILKILVVLTFLCYSCYTDVLQRRVSNKVWFWTLITCGWITALEVINGGAYCFALLLLSVISTWAVSTWMYSNGNIGGADAKGLMTLALLFPVYPAGELLGSSFPIFEVQYMHVFALSVLINTVFVSVAAPLGLAVYNLLHFEPEMLKNPGFMAQGYRTTVTKMLTKKHTVPLEHIDETLDESQKIWVTPLLPYMIFITIGYITAIIFGDLFFVGVGMLL